MNIIHQMLDKEVMVYKNLHKSKEVPMYSVVHNGKVVGHTPSICLYNCTFKVRKGGQQRVRREKRKTVHAFVVGKVWGQGTCQLGQKIKYNPYVNDTFVTEAGSPVLKATHVAINAKGVSAMEVE